MTDRCTIRVLVMAGALAAFGTSAAPPSQTAAVMLMHEHKCYVCHSNDEEVVGPAFVDVAAWYKDHPDALAIVAGLVRSGARGARPWHMPPHPELTAAEARVIAAYILSLRDHRPRWAHSPPHEHRQPATALSPAS